MSLSKTYGHAFAAALLGIASLAALPAEAKELKGSGRTPNNTMLVKIDPGGGLMSERITVYLNKGAIVELPSDVRDVMVANPSIVDAMVRTKRRTYLLGKSVGQTNLFFLDASGKQILNLEVRVERDLVVLKDMLKKYLPTSRIEVAALSDKVILSGFVPSAAAADKARTLADKFIGDGKKAGDNVINMLSIEADEQVMLKVRVVEMQRSLAKQFGVSWDAYFSPDVETGIGETVIGMTAENQFSVLGRALSASGIGVTNVGSTGGASAILQLMERTGLAKTLAEPTLTAISGEAANFLAGGEFPVPKGSDRDGNISVEFKQFGVGLGFTPVVMSDGRISMRISTEVSELTTAGAMMTGSSIVTDEDGSSFAIAGVSIPALRVRRAETTVELPSGGSLVMAGLLQESVRQGIDGIPGAKDLPVLGALFRSRDYQSEETELVIIVTPYLVKPANEHELKTPADGFAPPNDLGAILLGRLNSVYSVSGQSSNDASWQGPVGHIVD